MTYLRPVGEPVVEDGCTAITVIECYYVAARLYTCVLVVQLQF